MLWLNREPTNAWSVGRGRLVVYGTPGLVEIAYAFYRDPLSQPKDSDLKANDRIVMAIRSYFGVAFNFAVLYYFLPIGGLFKGPSTAISPALPRLSISAALRLPHWVTGT
jgi:hypothetical protein